MNSEGENRSEIQKFKHTQHGMLDRASSKMTSIGSGRRRNMVRGTASDWQTSTEEKK